MEEIERRWLLSSPLSAVPVLHSFPKASAKLFIDFDGNPAIDDWLGQPVPTTPAYDVDGDPTTFSSTELNNIKEIWSRVAEKYSPFNIDVTTQDPGNRDNFKTTQIVVGGSSADWLGAEAGGVAPISGFSNDSPNTGFVFPVGDIEALGRQMIACASDRRLPAALGANAKMRIASHGIPAAVDGLTDALARVTRH